MRAHAKVDCEAHRVNAPEPFQGAFHVRGGVETSAKIRKLSNVLVVAYKVGLVLPYCNFSWASSKRSKRVVSRQTTAWCPWLPLLSMGIFLSCLH